MDRVANAKCRTKVQLRQPFKGSNLWGEWVGSVYAVYSYGRHFPLWVYDPETEQWFGNADRYSVSTSKHRTQSQPLQVAIKWFDTETMSRLTRGGYRQMASDRVLFGGIHKPDGRVTV
jgi:hypothetical protein